MPKYIKDHWEIILAFIAMFMWAGSIQSSTSDLQRSRDRHADAIIENRNKTQDAAMTSARIEGKVDLLIEYFGINKKEK